MYALSYDMQVKPRPSEGKPWLKYFSPEAVAAPLPQDTLYGYLVAQNGAYPDNAALNYYGNRIPFGRALREIDRTADAYQALGVLPGEIVTCCSLAIPETVYSLYGLNKIGGVSNMIDPRASSKGIRNFVAETGSRVLVILDAILEKNLDMLPELDVDTIIVQTAERSLPPTARSACRRTSASSTGTIFCARARERMPGPCRTGRTCSPSSTTPAARPACPRGSCSRTMA